MKSFAAYLAELIYTYLYFCINTIFTPVEYHCANK